MCQADLDLEHAVLLSSSEAVVLALVLKRLNLDLLDTSTWASSVLGVGLSVVLSWSGAGTLAARSGGGLELRVIEKALWTLVGVGGCREALVVALGSSGDLARTRSLWRLGCLGSGGLASG